MATGSRSFAVGVGVVGFFLTTLAFCPSVYFRTENPHPAPRPTRSAAGPIMLALSLAGCQPGGLESGFLATDRAIGSYAIDATARSIGIAASTARPIAYWSAPCLPAIA